MSDALKVAHKHLLMLIDRDANAEGWTPVSEILFPFLRANLSDDLVTYSETVDGSSKWVKLTQEGKTVLKWS